jgi:hypothetical protein
MQQKLHNTKVFSFDRKSQRCATVSDSFISKLNSHFCLVSANGLYEAVASLLLNPNTNPATMNNLPIRLAAQNGCIRVLNMLLQDTRVGPSDENDSALTKAFIFGHHAVVERLSFMSE